MPLWCSIASTNVVLPWSTCAMMAMFRMSERRVGVCIEPRTLPSGIECYHPRLRMHRRGTQRFAEEEWILSRYQADRTYSVRRRGAVATLLTSAYLCVLCGEILSPSSTA